MANVIRLPAAQRRSGHRRTVPLSGVPRAEVIAIRRERTVEEKLEDAKAMVYELCGHFLSAVHVLSAHHDARIREARHD